MPPRGSSKHRPGFHAVVLAIGFIVGGLMTQVARHFLPAGAVKDFLGVLVAYLIARSLF